jgi:osmotically inducible protein OsmC
LATTRSAETIRAGSLLVGSGATAFTSSGIGTFSVPCLSRSEVPNGKTSPEELLAAFHASCFSMAPSSALVKEGSPPQSLVTQVEVDFQPSSGITGTRIRVFGDVAGLASSQLEAVAYNAKTNRAISRALSSVPIELSFA